MSRATERHGHSNRRRAAMADDRWWGRIRPLAQSLLEGDPDLEADGGEVREFVAGSVRCRARAIPLRSTARAPRTVVVAIERAPDRLPSVGQLRERFRLTPREAEVALLLADRRTNREIARELDTTQHTARRHTEKVLLKLGVRSRTQVEPALRGRAAGARRYRR